MPCRYLLFYKPFGVPCQFSGERPTLADFVKVTGVYPVGRLDKDSEGLLILTDDGEFQHRLTDPKHEHPKTYWAQVEREPSAEAMARLARGVRIENYVTKPAKVRLLEGEPDVPPRNPPIRFRKTVPAVWIELILTEGRNRQVRKMTAAIGHPTLRLIRVASGPVPIAGVAPGEWRDLAPAEVRKLRRA